MQLYKAFLPVLFFSLVACQTQTVVDEAVADKAIVNTASDTTQVKTTPQMGKARRVSDDLIEEWLAEEKYTRVLGSLESVPEFKRTKQDRAQLRKIKELADEYDRKQSDTIEQLYESGDRKTAMELLRKSFNNYSDGSRLWFVKKQIQKQQNNYVREIESQILLARGQWLIQSVPLYKEFLKVEPDDMKTVLAEKQAKEDIVKVASRLTALGIHALAANDYDLASQRLNMANTLVPTSENIAALARLDHLIFEKRVIERDLAQLQEEKQRRLVTRKRLKDQRARQAKADKAGTRLVDKIDHAFSKDEILQAKILIAKLKRIDKSNVDLPRLQQNLDKSVVKKVDVLLEKGSGLYSNGQIEKAKKLWESALALDPSNKKVKARIKRAELVLSKLRELQIKSTGK
jgi:tetratricopeptide (TPR) repeat protein